MTSAKPAISVITPTFNRRSLLAETMDSMAAQTTMDWEHLIVDDGSDDGTAEDVLRRAAQDPRVRYLPRAGAVAGANVCRNQGAAAAKADLLVFLDSDDLLDPDCLRRRIALMDRNRDLDFAVTRTGVFVQRVDDLGRELDPRMLGDDLLRFLFFETPWQTTASTWRREAFERLGGFDEALPSWQDVDLHVRAIAGGLRYLRFPEVDHHMRWQEDPAKASAQQRRAPAHLAAAEDLLVKFERVVREGPGMNWLRQRALCSLYFFVAEGWMRAGDRPAALRVWRKMRERRLGSAFLHASGAALLAAGVPGGRVAHKWKGWMHLRSDPELVP